MLDMFLSGFQWYRKLRKGQWYHVQMRYVVGCPEYWIRDKEPFEYETVLEVENHD